MKTSIAAFFIFASIPIYAHEKVKEYDNHKNYTYQDGYAYEEKCFRYEYREDYIPGTSVSPGYVKSYKEKISVPCNNENRALNHHKYNSTQKNEYVNHVTQAKCTGNTTLGGLIGGGIAASLSEKDAYSWSIPLGAVLGAGIGNAGCKN